MRIIKRLFVILFLLLITFGCQKNNGNTNPISEEPKEVTIEDKVKILIDNYNKLYSNIDSVSFKEKEDGSLCYKYNGSENFDNLISSLYVSSENSNSFSHETIDENENVTGKMYYICIPKYCENQIINDYNIYEEDNSIAIFINGNSNILSEDLKLYSPLYKCDFQKMFGLPKE